MHGVLVNEKKYARGKMKKTIRDVDWKNKVAIMRCDFNVPMTDGQITDDTRIKAAIPTIKYLIEKEAGIVIMSHLGRPKGNPNQDFSLKPVADRLAEYLNKTKVTFVPSDNVVDSEVKEKVSSIKPGEIILLENVRFRSEEEKNDKNFAKELSTLGDIFVQEAFGTAHRAHASTTGIAEFIPAVSGFLIEKELKFLGEAVENPKKPFAAIMGGAKVADKIPVMTKLIEKVDMIFVGGGMLFTFLKAQGYEIGKSLLDEEGIIVAKDIMKLASEQNVKFMLPVDVVCSDDFSNDSKFETVSIESIPENMMGMDIGPKTINLYVEELKKANTVLWNGPMGVFEMSNFENGTKEIARCLAECNATTIIGGGDSTAAAVKFGFADKMTHISTGGGASLEYLEGKILPGIDVIDEK